MVYVVRTEELRGAIGARKHAVDGLLQDENEKKKGLKSVRQPESQKSAPARKPRALREGSLPSKLARVSPKGPHTYSEHS
eukprot:372342-Pelagomonas_calceolata.AAC.1